MTGPTYLCFDLGLTHAKSVLFGPDGDVIALASVPYPTDRSAPGRVEQEPNDWWTALQTGVAELAADRADALSRLDAIGVTGHMHALVLEDSSRRPIGPAFVLGDRRASAEAGAITSELGAAAIWHTTGATLDPSMPAAELRWLGEHEPERIAKATLITGVKDHLRGRLTGDRLTEPIDACATSLYDIRNGAWAPELTAAAGVGISQLPEVVACESTAGTLQAEPARDLGLLPGIPVIVGAGDDIEVLAGGLLEPGVAMEHLGTTGSILAVTSEPLEDPELAIELYPHPIPDRWVVGGSMTAAGAALAWVARLLGTDIEGLLPALENPSRHTGGADQPVFLPSLAGERCPVREPAARGAWLGVGSTFDWHALASAAFEGVAASLARILTRIEQLLGPQDEVIVSAGGLDVDPRWMALRAATYDRPLVRLATPEPTALGLLAVVTAGAGRYADLATASRALTRRASRVDPDPQAVELASRRRRHQSAAEEPLLAVWPRLPG
jgi:xylulokinase